MYFTYPGTHCLSAPIPPNNTELIVSGWNGDPFNFDSPATYVCKRGQKYEQNFTQVQNQVMCRENNTWEVPANWPNCIESEFNT